MFCPRPHSLCGPCRSARSTHGQSLVAFVLAFQVRGVAIFAVLTSCTWSKDVHSSQCNHNKLLPEVIDSGCLVMMSVLLDLNLEGTGWCWQIDASRSVLIIGGRARSPGSAINNYYIRAFSVSNQISIASHVSSLNGNSTSRRKGYTCNGASFDAVTTLVPYSLSIPSTGCTGLHDKLISKHLPQPCFATHLPYPLKFISSEVNELI